MSQVAVVLVNAERSLDAIAESVRENWNVVTGTATERSFAIGHDLSEARGQFVGDTEYGQWFKEQGFPFARSWAHTLRVAAENEPAVRVALSSQVDGGKNPNLKKAVATVLHPEPESIPPTEPTPLGVSTPFWTQLLAVREAIQELGVVSPEVMAASVPERRRRAFAKELRAAGRTLGAVASHLEVME